MLTYDIIVIGFGKAGKTLASKMSELGKKVALIEESSSMYGGTCINIGCIPTKTLLMAAKKNLSFDEVIKEKQEVTTRLNKKNYLGLEKKVDIIDAKAKFVSNKVISAVKGNEEKLLTAETIIINTGAVSNILPIPGLTTSKNVVDSTGIQNLKELPKNLGILGGGNIGIEFAGIFNKLGSNVTILDTEKKILPRSEEIVSKLAQEYLSEQGINFEFEFFTKEIKNNDEGKVIVSSETTSLEFDVLLYATGRKPNTESLALENTDIELTARGAIKVDKNLQTSVPNVFAVGDVNGGLQFTYISLDDYRIVFDYLTKNGEYNLETRKNVPNTTFITPPVSQIGITEAQAKEMGLPYAAKEILVSSMPRAHVNADLRGVFKAVVNTDTKEILGATIFSEGAEEIINIITVAMDNNIPYTYFTKQIFTHPTLAENLNDLFAI